MCGSKSVTWTQMRVAMHMMRICFEQLKACSEEEKKGRLEDALINNKPAPIINNALDLLYHRERTQKKRPEQTESLATELSWCLGLNKARLCREPQDRTFSVLGFAGKTFRDQVHPDYRKSPEEHYRSVVYWFVTATGSFDVILHTQHTAWPYTGSSWAPDWRQAERAAVFHQNQQGFSSAISITDHEDFSIAPESPILRIKGVILGTVSAIKLEYGALLDPAQPYYDVATADGPHDDLPRRARVWWEFKYAEHNEGRLLNDTIPHLPASSPLWKRHLELFLGVIATNWYPEACGSFNEEWGKEFVKEQLPEEERFDGVEDFWDVLIYILTSRTVCVMNKNTLVLAQNYARCGDCVALLVGCSNPVLLRPQNDGTYVLLGDAHVLGLNPDNIDRKALVEMILL